MDSDEIERKMRRRQRLEGLRGNAAGVAPVATDAAQPARKAAGGKVGGGKLGGGKARGMMAGEGEEGAMRRKAIGRIMRILTETPADATGMVPGTTFSKAGVARLMEMLDDRAAKQGAGGGKAAQRVKAFLAPKDGEEAIHGASLQKLQRAGQMAAKRGGGRRRDI